MRIIVLVISTALSCFISLQMEKHPPSFPSYTIPNFHVNCAPVRGTFIEQQINPVIVQSDDIRRNFDDFQQDETMFVNLGLEAP